MYVSTCLHSFYLKKETIRALKAGVKLDKMLKTERQLDIGHCIRHFNQLKKLYNNTQG